MRLFFSLIFCLFIQITAFADIIPETIYAVTPKYLSANNLYVNDVIDLYVLKTGKFSSDLNLDENEKIEVKIINYVEPKRGKKNGYFIIEYKSDEIMKGTMRASVPTDFKEIAKNAGVSIAGTILKIPGFSQAVAFSKGLVSPNENQSRFQSATTNLYESTPLKYLKKGSTFEVEEDGIVVIKLKRS